MPIFSSPLSRLRRPPIIDEDQGCSDPQTRPPTAAQKRLPEEAAILLSVASVTLRPRIQLVVKAAKPPYSPSQPTHRTEGKRYPLMTPLSVITSIAMSTIPIQKKPLSTKLVGSECCKWLSCNRFCKTVNNGSTTSGMYIYVHNPASRRGATLQTPPNTLQAPATDGHNDRWAP